MTLTSSRLSRGGRIVCEAQETAVEGHLDRRFFFRLCFGLILLKPKLGKEKELSFKKNVFFWINKIVDIEIEKVIIQGFVTEIIELKMELQWLL